MICPAGKVECGLYYSNGTSQVCKDPEKEDNVRGVYYFEQCPWPSRIRTDRENPKPPIRKLSPDNACNPHNTAGTINDIIDWIRKHEEKTK